MQAIDRCASVSASVSFFSQDETSRSRFNEVFRAADDVNHFLKIIRTAISCANKWIKISDDFVKVIKYTKFISSTYGLFAIPKLIVSLRVLSQSDNVLGTARALWPVIRNAKKVGSSVAWFAIATRQMGLVSEKNVSWARKFGIVQVPFQVISIGVSVLRIGKLVVIWIELERYSHVIKQCRSENRPRNCYIVSNYLQQTHVRLSNELRLSPNNHLDARIAHINSLLATNDRPSHLLAVEQSEQILNALRIRVQKQGIGELLNTAAKTFDLASSFFETTCPACLFSLSLLSTISTLFKMANHFYCKYQTPKNALILPLPVPAPPRICHAPCATKRT